jgi:hypothetical protein
MNDNYRDVLAEAASDPAQFRGLTFSGRTGKRITARLTIIKESPAVMVTVHEKGRETTRCTAWDEWPSHVRDLLAHEYDFLHVRRTDGDWHVKITRKGHVLMTRGKPAAVETPAPTTSHDREKAYLLTPATSGDFLRSLDALDEQGRIRPSMQAKYRQINGFLNLLVPVLPAEQPEPGPYVICDCGCGSAHLSFAVYHYLTRIRGWDVALTGIDRNADLMARNTLWQERLGWKGLSFVASDLADYVPPGPVNLVLSLHACDTATDLALARGAEWKAELIISAPCCQHELHHQMESEPFQALLRHGILRERMADLVTDALRAAALRLCGYAVKVMEFATAADTPRNLLIRVVRTGHSPEAAAVKEYRDLKAFWRVEPEIERLLKPMYPDRFT